MIVYKIRNKNAPEKFLTGTPYYHRWEQTGRMFQTLGKLRTFLTNTLKCDRDISNWEVIEYELSEISAKGVHEMIKPEQIVKLLTK